MFKNLFQKNPHFILRAGIYFQIRREMMNKLKYL